MIPSANVQGRKTLLAVQNCGEFLKTANIRLLVVAVVSVVVIADKLVKLVFLASFAANLPEEKRSYWVTSNQRVEKPFYLVRFPYELPLDRRQ